MASDEVVHISLGETANHVTSHLLNLQGLAATASNASETSLCDPLVTHEVSQLDASPATSSSRYVYVPRTLIVDGSFGAEWGCVSGNNSGGHSGQTPPSSSLSVSRNDPRAGITSWDGAVTILNPSDCNITGEEAGSSHPLDERKQSGEEDPLQVFHAAASTMGLSHQYSRFNSSAPRSFSSNSRHVNWDDLSEEGDDVEDDCYGHDQEMKEEERRRRLEQLDCKKQETKKSYNSIMEDAFEAAFYSDAGTQGDERDTFGDREASDEANGKPNEPARDDSHELRKIQWHDYWMPPKPPPTKYQVSLPFDTSSSKDGDAWSTSFNLGYQPGNAQGSGDASGVTRAWREHVMSESLRKQLESCDTVKGFNICVDGGNHRLGRSDKSAGGGFYAGLATSLLEELQEECRSAGRFVSMLDPLSCSDKTMGGSQATICHGLNAGLALHGLASNASSFLPLSIEGAHQALREDAEAASTSRTLFEGSAAVALALEAATLSYRFHRQRPDSLSPARGRIGIQSGYYQGYCSQGDDANEPYASAPSLTYHEFLACMQPSSGKRSILELDALMKPITFPSSSNDQNGSQGSVNLSSLLSAGQVSPAVLASFVSSGLIAGGPSKSELCDRIMRGTSSERQMEQQHRSSRRGGSTRQHSPGEWLEDASAGGLMSSLSGNSKLFGTRSLHYHFTLSASNRPADVCKHDEFGTLLRPTMESLGVEYRPEVSMGVVANDSVVKLTELGSYWPLLFVDMRNGSNVSARTVASHTPILSVLGNSTRSYPRLRSVSSGFATALKSRKGFLSRDILLGLAPEIDDCEEACEYCRELVDEYEPPSGSGLAMDDENTNVDSYFDEG
mmetsp:Transcript_28884/g.65766  ORF Transcript_28884/g.65766 Transcript_28884/m.65766 type:complete len:846 (-) Transcript_28884:40-2577(-)